MNKLIVSSLIRLLLYLNEMGVGLGLGYYIEYHKINYKQALMLLSSSHAYVPCLAYSQLFHQTEDHANSLDNDVIQAQEWLRKAP